MLELFDVTQCVLGGFDEGVVVGVDDEFNAGGFRLISGTLEHTEDLISLERCILADDDPEFGIDAFETLEDGAELWV